MKTLIIAGTGIKFLSHLTVEVKAIIEQSSCVIYLLNEPAIKKWISDNSKKSISMDSIYFSSSLRKNAYSNIANKILKELDNYNDLVFLTYGHPTFFSSVTTELTDKIDNKSIKLHIMPSISALDCLCADLKIDPGIHGLQSYEATEFILRDHDFSPYSHLIL